MSDISTQARLARTHLAQALNALQLDGVPKAMEQVAESVAQAMSLLHRIETKGDQGPTASQVLTLLRGALNQLQNADSVHPSTEAALEIVASSLGQVHQLARALVPEPVPKGPPMMAPTPVDPAPMAPTPAPVAPQPVAQRPGHQPLGTAPTESALAAPAAKAGLLPPDPVAGKPGQTGPAADEDPIPLSRISSPPTMASAPPQAPAPPAERPSNNPEPPQRISGNPVALPALAATPGETFVEAALGAYSTTNFYKGLSGNDLIDAGGLFVATYAPPEIGQRIRIQVSLPGGFEFQARGEVSWVREMPKSGSLNPLSPPGFGVRFTEISKEARQLVYRYVRNREPLFYDDL